MKHKVVAYITRGRELLVFEHEGMPEAGVQALVEFMQEFQNRHG